MSVITFEDYTPTPREDAPWTSAVIEEAGAAVGPWDQIDAFAFDDPDSDPSNPKPRSFTTTEAELISGWYRVVFVDDDSNRDEFEPLQYPPVAEPIPSVEDIGRLLRTRTKDADNNYLETFTDTTEPTDTQVRRTIRQAYRDVLLKTGSLVLDSGNEDILAGLESMVTYRAVMLVELTFFPDQVRSGKSAYDNYKDLYDEGMKGLLESIVDAGIGSGGESAGGLPQPILAQFDRYDRIADQAASPWGPDENRW